MSKYKVGYAQLQQADAKLLSEFETQLYRNMHRDDAMRRDAKSGGKRKRRGRPRRSSSSSSS
jgi:hypothetical protein